MGPGGLRIEAYNPDVQALPYRHLLVFSVTKSNEGVRTPISGKPRVSGEFQAISGRSTTKGRYKNIPLVLLFVLVPRSGSKSARAVKLRWWCSGETGLPGRFHAKQALGPCGVGSQAQNPSLFYF
ncbi:hypothetical protein DVH24_009571 [Malus domestica]|uniref:Uncharacterized protein n=1 Tax=Malus domestica TaxID=3750 RepID=A0A498JLA9_MALDO|nr:hypothetical protein DVH24_009571 [Malus domestica]